MRNVTDAAPTPAARFWAMPGSIAPMPTGIRLTPSGRVSSPAAPGGEIWTRPHLDERTRRVLVIRPMMAVGRWEEFRMPLRAALVEGGFSPDDIKEIILQQAIYCGVPVGNHAFRQAGEVLEELAKSA